MEVVEGPGSRLFDAFLDRLYRLTRIERSGRLYAALGIRSLYAVVARMAGERPLDPPSRAFEPEAFPFSRADIDRTRSGAKYFEFANLMRALLYVPTMVAGLRLGVPLAWVWSLLLVWTHLSMMGIERYKRILCDHYEPLLAPDYQPPEPPPIETDPTSRGYFARAPWETEGFYRALGFERFRLIVHFYANRTRLTAEQRRRGEKFRYVEKVNREAMRAYLASTRISETVHLVGAVLNLPILVPFALSGHRGWAWFAGCIVLFDVYCSGLQRYHRVRAGRLARRRTRAA